MVDREINWELVRDWLKTEHPELQVIANGYFYRRMMTDPGTFSMREAAVNILPRLDPSAEILDVGTGVGTWLLYLHRNGYTGARGIDINRYSTVPIAFDLLNEFGGLGGQVGGGNLWEIEGRYDLITIFDCLYDLSPRQRPISEVLSHLRLHLKPGGLAAFDYYVSEEHKKPGRGYREVDSMSTAALASGLAPIEVFVRILGGREIAFYVFRAK